MKLRTASVVALAALATAPAVADAKKPAQDPRIPLPVGWQPEGIAAAPGGDLYVGSLATGDVLRLDPRTGESRVAIDAPDGAQANGLERFGGGRVVVTGNRTGFVRIYRERDGAQTAAVRPAPQGTESFTNDVAVVGRKAYVTDSSLPNLYEVDRRGAVRTIALQGVTYGEGINLNGIVRAKGRTLYAVQSNTGALYRIRAGSGQATAVDTGGYALTQGDGIEYRAGRLYVVQNRSNKIAVLRLGRDGTTARLVDTITSPDFDVPTTAVFRGRELFAVNARFGNPAPATAEYWVTRLGKQ